MNFRGDYFIFVVLSIIQTITSNELPEFNVCPNAPTNLQTVHAEVYFNGCTYNDGVLFGRICSWREGFSDDDVSLTFKVGADVTFENDKWTCLSDVEYDCNCVFQYACLSQMLDGTTFLDFVCCAQKKGDPAQWVNQCITEYGLDDAVADCLNGNTDYDPKQIVLDNAQEILDAGIDVCNDVEPFLFFEQTYDKCTSDQGVDWWAQSVCKMLTAERFNEVQNCLDAFGLS